MPKFRGVYKDAKGAWYFKASTHKDPLTGKWAQVTRRGFTTAAAAAAAREELLREAEAQPKATVSGLTVRQLVEQYLDECEATERLGAKSLFDYRHYLDDYIDPWIGSLRVRELTAEVVASWQHKLATEGGKKTGRGLSPNTIRLARAPLNGALKQAVAMGVLPANPLASVPRPKPRRSIPKHWSPDEARQFLALHEGDRLWPVWAFLVGSGVRIGELVFLAWSNVDLEKRLVRVNEFATVLGYDVQRSSGKSHEAIRTIDLDRHLVDVLRQQRKLQAEEQLRAATYEAVRLRVHEGDGWRVPPAVPVATPRQDQHRGRPPAADRSRPPPHKRHPDAGERSASEGGRRATRPRRHHSVLQPLQPRHPHHAARCRRTHRRRSVRRSVARPGASTPGPTNMKRRSSQSRSDGHLGSVRGPPSSAVCERVAPARGPERYGYLPAARR